MSEIYIELDHDDTRYWNSIGLGTKIPHVEKIEKIYHSQPTVPNYDIFAELVAYQQARDTLSHQMDRVDDMTKSLPELLRDQQDRQKLSDSIILQTFAPLYAVNRESYFEALRIAGVDAQTIRNMENADNTAGNRYLENIGVNIESIATSLRQNPLYQSQLQMQQLFSNLPRNRAGSEGSVMSRFSRGGTLDETVLQRLRDAAVPGLVKGLLGCKDPGDTIESLPGDDPDTTAQSIVGHPISGAGVEIGASPDGPIYAFNEDKLWRKYKQQFEGLLMAEHSDIQPALFTNLNINQVYQRLLTKQLNRSPTDAEIRDAKNEMKERKKKFLQDKYLEELRGKKK